MMILLAMSVFQAHPFNCKLPKHKQFCSVQDFAQGMLQEQRFSVFKFKLRLTFEHNLNCLFCTQIPHL